MKIRCVITDDEPLARKGLQGYISKVTFLELVGVCENPVELNNLLKEQEVDLLFLDIEMPYMTGIEFLRSIPDPPKVIFTTAYDKYAMQGFELEVLDYLLKPVSFDRFMKSANKAYEYFRSRETTAAEADHLFIKTDNKIEKVRFDEILFIEALENYIGIFTEQRKYITHSTLKAIIDKLPPNRFVQTHKSFVVSISRVNSIEGNILHVGQHQVPVSKYMKEEVLERIVNNALWKK